MSKKKLKPKQIKRYTQLASEYAESKNAEIFICVKRFDPWDSCRSINDYWMQYEENSGIWCEVSYDEVVRSFSSWLENNIFITEDNQDMIEPYRLNAILQLQHVMEFNYSDSSRGICEFLIAPGKVLNIKTGEERLPQMKDYFFEITPFSLYKDENNQNIPIAYVTEILETPDVRHLIIKCPFCQQKHSHGGGKLEPINTYLSSRANHCKKSWKRRDEGMQYYLLINENTKYSKKLYNDSKEMLKIILSEINNYNKIKKTHFKAFPTDDSSIAIVKDNQIITVDHLGRYFNMDDVLSVEVELDEIYSDDLFKNINLTLSLYNEIIAEESKERSEYKFDDQIQHLKQIFNTNTHK